MAFTLVFTAVSVYADTPAIVLGGDALQKKNTVWFGKYRREYTGVTAQAQWRVLSGGEDLDPVDDDPDYEWPYISKKGEALMVSSRCLDDYVYFKRDSSSNAWAGSDAQEWCVALYNNWADSCEKSAIRETSIVETDDKVYNGSNYFYFGGYLEKHYSAAPLSGEHFFFLSAREAEKLFADDSDRIALHPVGYDSNGAWWLRSPRCDSLDNAWVDDDGKVREKETENASGVRPAFNLDLSRVLFTSASGAKTSDGSTLAAVSRGGYTDWKLTLLDDTRTFVPTVSALRCLPGRNVTIPYENANAGDSVSVLLCDDTGPLYYGSVPVSGENGKGSAEFTLPAGLTLGETYTLCVFSEKKNGEHESDYASAITELPLTVSFSGTGSRENPYKIQSEDEWDALAALVKGGLDTKNLCFQLANDISVKTMIGSIGRLFEGIFDGNGKTLTIEYSNSSKSTDAPFAYIRDATICNLLVEGKVEGTSDKASGLVGENYGSSTITNCRVSATITGNILAGGFCIGAGDNGSLSITGCVFDGKINAADQSSGFVAWGTNGLSIKDCVFAPQSDTSFTGGPFYYNLCHELENCYYLTLIGTAQGKQAHNVTVEPAVPLAFGEGTAYPVSRITAYPVGLSYNGVCRAGKEESVPLTFPGLPDGTRADNLTASPGKLTEADGKWTLLMPDEDVVISASLYGRFKGADFHIPEKVTSIGANAFEGAKMTAVEISGECTSIGAEAFKGCESLVKIRIPASVTSIDKTAFDGCGTVYVYGTAESAVQGYCGENLNCVFVEEK